MATTNRSVYGLTIALIVFVLLTFILTITTYLFFKQRMDEQAKAQVAEKARAEKDVALTNSQKENEKLREFIGAAKDSGIEKIETDFNGVFTSEFSGFDGEKSYRRLLEWLRDEFKKKGELTKAAEDARSRSEEEKVALKKSTDESRKAADDRVETLRKEFEKDKATFDTERADNEKEKDDLLKQKQTAEQQSKRLEALINAVAMLQDALPTERQQQFAAAKAEDQLEVVRKELVTLRKTIKSQNDDLRVFRSSGPDDRIDGFDGHVATVDAGQGSVTIHCPTTRGARPGMELRVFQPDEQRPTNDQSKATLVVTRIEGPTRLRAAIRDESPTRPIIPGDAVASPLWAPGPLEIVVAGRVNLGRGAGAEDRTRLRRVIEGAGGILADTVGPATAFVLDAGGFDKDAAADDEATRQLRTQRDAAVRDARRYGVTVGGLDGLLDILGLSRTDVVTAPPAVVPTR